MGYWNSLVVGGHQQFKIYYIINSIEPENSEFKKMEQCQFLLKGLDSIDFGSFVISRETRESLFEQLTRL